MYDVTSTQSFYFIQNIREQILATEGLTNIPIIVVGNKSDLSKNKAVDDEIVVKEQSRSKQEIISVVRKTWRATYVECSVKYNWNVSAAFKEVAREIINHKENIAKEVEEDKPSCCAISMWY